MPYIPPLTTGPLTTAPLNPRSTVTLPGEIVQVFNGQHVRSNLVADCRADWVAALVDSFNEHQELEAFRNGATELFLELAQKLQDLASASQDPAFTQELNDLVTRIQAYLPQGQ